MLKKIFYGLGILCALGTLALLWDVGLRPAHVNPALVWKAPEGDANIERGTILDLSFSDDGKTLIGYGTGSKAWDSKLKQNLAAHVVTAWDASNGKPTNINDFFKSLPWTKIKELCGDNIAIGRAGQLVRVVGSKPFFRNQSIDVLQIPDGKKVWSLSLPDTNLGWSLSKLLISQDKQYLFALFSTDDATTREWVRSKGELWDMRTGELLWMRERSNPNSRDDYAFLGNNGTVVNISSGKALNSDEEFSLIIRKEQNDQILATLPFPQEFARDTTGQRFITSVSPDGRLMAGVWVFRGPTRVVCFCWDIQSKSLKWQYSEKVIGSFNQVKFSPDSRLVALGIEVPTDDHNYYYRPKAKIVIFDSQAGQVKTILTEETSRDLAQQRWLNRKATARGKTYNWLSKVGVRFPYTVSDRGNYLPGDSGAIFALTFSPDGKSLAAGYESGSIKLWRMPE